MTCRYINSLDRECGREATSGEHCDLHAVLSQLDAYDPNGPALDLEVPSSQWPRLKPVIHALTVGTEVPGDVTGFGRWAQNPTIHINQRNHR